MFDNPVLDIAIGLAFVYVLYSLLATTIKEFLASVYSYRGRMLERGIEQMLDGQNWGYYWWHKWYNWVTWQVRKSGFNINKHDFLSNKTLHPNFKAKHPRVKRARLDRKAKLFASQVFNHPLYKRLSAGNRLSNKPAYLPAAVFSKIITDLFSGSKPGPVLMNDISAAIKRGDCNIGHETQQVLLLYAKQANGDLQNFQRQVEGWYNDTMDRVSGWYKKQTTAVLLVIGFLLAMQFNVSTIEIVTRLSEDKNARNAIVQSATAYVQKHAGEFSQPQPVAAKDTSTKKTGAVKDTAFDKAATAVTKIKTLYNTDISEQNVALGLGWGDFGFKADSLDAVKKREPIPEHRCALRKVTYVIYQTLSAPRRLIGFLITAFAISLGAPFWFDLLNKFVNLRNAGKKPDEGTNSGNAASGNNKPQPNSFA